MFAARHTALLALIAVACSATLSFKEWRDKHRITTPPTADEEEWFRSATASIEALAATSPHATFSVGPYTGRPWAQPRGTVTGSAPLNTFMFTNQQIAEALGASKDWVMTPATADQGAVTRVKNQGHCGSCWAFGTVVAIEGMYKASGNSLSALSEQYILSCLPATPGLNGCSGGDIRVLAQTLAGGAYALPLERNYEYQSFDNLSYPCNTTIAATGFVSVTNAYAIGTQAGQQMEDAMAAWVYFNGPVVVGVASWQPAFQAYQQGIANCPSVSLNQLDHGVAIVGYGSEVINGVTVPYWKIKNSWTPAWGESGYIRLQRGNNGCGVALIPTVVQV